MTHPDSERWSDYLDGAVAPAEAVGMKAHLAECPACAALVDDLRRVIARAGGLDERPPRRDLWPSVASAIGARRRRLSFSVPELLAASIALMLLTGGAVAHVLRRPAEPVAAPLVATSPAVPPVMSAAATRGYDAAVRELERELDLHRDRLDSATVRLVTEKLALIDHAILEAERALATYPRNAYLNDHLAQTQRRKLDLLRRAADLTRAVS